MQQLHNHRSKKIRRGDVVVVIAGNQKGAHGKVLRIVEDRAVIEGLNFRKKTVKRSEKFPQGGFIDIEAPIHLSNLSPADANGSRIKVKIRFSENGEKEFYYLKDGQAVVWRTINGPRK